MQRRCFKQLAKQGASAPSNSFRVQRVRVRGVSVDHEPERHFPVILLPLLQSGEAELQENGAPVRDPQRLRELLPAELERNLKELMRLALLIA